MALAGHTKGQVTIPAEVRKPWISRGRRLLFEVVRLGKPHPRASSATPVGPLWSTSGHMPLPWQGKVRTEVGQGLGTRWRDRAVSPALDKTPT